MKMSGLEFEQQYKEIKRLQLNAQIEILKTVAEHPDKPGYKRHDVLDKIKQLQNDLLNL